MADIPVQCTRCRNKHMESERKAVPRHDSEGFITFSDLCCPRCGAKSFYDMRPQVAWCWASGLIEIGDAAPAGTKGTGCIVIASGPKASLVSRLTVMARHGQGASNGKLLVPGVPEATNQAGKGDALEVWLAFCARRNGFQGVYFVTEKLPAMGACA